MIFEGIGDSRHTQNDLKLLLKDSAFNSALTHTGDFKKLGMGKFEVLSTPSFGLPSLVQKIFKIKIQFYKLLKTSFDAVLFTLSNQTIFKLF
jgi:hypothetical protein